jgi:predicted MFS family arabinose efflux permease
MNRWTFFYCFLLGFLAGITALLMVPDVQFPKNDPNEHAYDVAALLGLLAGALTLMGLIVLFIWGVPRFP